MCPLKSALQPTTHGYKTKIAFGPWVFFAVSNPEPVMGGQTWTGRNSAKDEPLQWKQQGFSECAADVEKKRALQMQETHLATSQDWRKWRGNWGIPEAAAGSLLPAPGLSVTCSVLQRGGLSLFSFCSRCMWSVLPFVQMCSCATAGVWHSQLPKKLQIQALCKFPQSYSEGSVPAAEMLDYGFIFSWETKG